MCVDPESTWEGNIYILTFMPGLTLKPALSRILFETMA